MEQKWIPKLGTRIIRIQTEQHYIINKVEKHFSKKEVKYHLEQEDGPVDLIVGYDELKTLFRPIKQTNADRIRSMTDEELALAIMCPAEYDLNFSKNEKCNGEMNKNCYECSLKWLLVESEE